METQPSQPEKIYSQATQEVKIIGISPISIEMVRLLDLKENETQEDYLKRISETLKNFPERFPQIAPEVKEFLRETAQEKPGYFDEEELRVLLLTLLSTPKPDEQKEELSENKELLLKEKAREIKREIRTNALIEISLKEVKPLTRLSFFAAITKEEREGYREQIEDVLKQATLWHRLNFFDAITPEERKQYHKEIENSLKEAGPRARLKFFDAITPEERKQYHEEIKDTLKEAKPWDRLYFFDAITPEERKQYHKEIENSLKEVGPGARLNFFGAITPEERKQYHKEIENSLKEVGPGARLNFFGAITPEERKEHQEEIEDLLKEVKPLTRLSFFAAITKEEREGYREQIEDALKKDTLWHRLDFFGAITPEERKKYQEEIKNSLKEAVLGDCLYFFGAITPEERKKYQEEIKNSLKEAGPGDCLGFHGVITPEERSISPLAQKLSQRVITELTSEIGDLGLRRKYFTLLFDYLGKKNSSLIALKNLYIPKEKLALVLGLEFLGANPLPSLSWQLKPQEHLDLLYSLSRLAEKEENRGLFKDLILPFRPKERKVAGFERSLLSWIRALDFLNSLGALLDSRKILEEHLNWIKERQKEEGIETTSLEVRFSFLKEIAQESERIKTKVKDNFQQLLGLEKLDSEKFEEFINNWLGEIESIFILAQRLHQPYPEVKKLLAQTVLAEIEGRWTKSRYNLENPLTRKQLRPLIKGKSQEEINDLILSYHQGIKFILEEKKGEEAISEKAIFGPPDELKERLKENLLAHQHFREIFKLKEFQNLTDEEMGLIERYVLSVFFEKEKIPFKTPKELSEYFQNKIPQETLKVLVILHQFLKDFAFGKKSSEDLLNSLERGLKAIKEKIPETENLALFSQDLGEWLKAEIKARTQSKETKPRKRILLVHTTDHPKTLLEIGKYPLNSGSCQSYDYSDLELAKSLLGYVFDSHIQAVVIREIETQKGISEIVSIDEGKRKVKVKTKDGEIIEVQTSRPIARAMFFLGEKEGQGVFLLQRDYHQPGVIDPNLAQELEQKALSQFIEKLNANYDLNLRLAEIGERFITIAGSHNPEGHYNDIAGGQRGQEGESYTI